MNRVLVTAGASGIGLAVTLAFHASGAHVCICGIDEPALQRAAEEMPGLLIRRCEVGARAQVTAMVADATPRLGSIDVLVNNGGISGPAASVQELDPADWDAVIKVNLTGTFDVTQNAIAYLIRSGRGVIINMAYSAGRMGHPQRSPYTATKAGLAHHSLKALVDPEDVAALAVFVASDAAKTISGQLIPIDGDQQRA